MDILQCMFPLTRWLGPPELMNVFLISFPSIYTARSVKAPENSHWASQGLPPWLPQAEFGLVKVCFLGLFGEGGGAKLPDHTSLIRHLCAPARLLPPRCRFCKPMGLSFLHFFCDCLWDTAETPNRQTWPSQPFFPYKKSHNRSRRRHKADPGCLRCETP